MKIKSKENIGRTLLRGRVGGMCSALALLVAPCAHAAVITIEASTDGFIRGSDTSSAGSFADPTILIGDTGSGTSRYINALLKFNLNSLVLPANAVIDSATLTFTSTVDTSSFNGSVSFEMYQSLRNFSTGATWNTYTSSAAWETKGGTGSLDRSSTLLSSIMLNPALIGEGATITLDGSAALITLVESLKGTSNPLNLWFGLSPSNMDGNRHILQVAAENNAIYAGPTLSINYTVIPEPSAISLALAAGGVLVMVRHRKKTGLLKAY